MLLITRKPGQSFFVGPDIRIKIDRISGDRIRIAIDAPDAVRICREEIIDRYPFAETAPAPKPAEAEHVPT